MLFLPVHQSLLVPPTRTEQHCWVMVSFYVAVTIQKTNQHLENRPQVVTVLHLLPSFSSALLFFFLINIFQSPLLLETMQFWKVVFQCAQSRHLPSWLVAMLQSKILPLSKRLEKQTLTQVEFLLFLRDALHTFVTLLLVSLLIMTVILFSFLSGRLTKI